MLSSIALRVGPARTLTSSILRSGASRCGRTSNAGYYVRSQKIWRGLAVYAPTFGRDSRREHSTGTISSAIEQKKPAAAGPQQYTAAFALIEALWEAGIKHIFLNTGAEHAPLIESFIHGTRTRASTWPRLITCPSEITAISAADGHARITGLPAAVLVHVDVGTQALGQGVHNASVGRAPVFILAGLVPFTESGELQGGRTEYMHWLQDVSDQTGIVRQYCRWTGEVKSGRNVKQLVNRGLQFARSSPKGPVYLTAAREVLCDEIDAYRLEQGEWSPVGASALPDDAVENIAHALVHAERPLVITGYSGRDTRTPSLLTALADSIPTLRVLDTGGSDVCFPSNHAASRGFRLGGDESVSDADVILVLDCDVPWIPTRNPPRKGAKVYHVDIDPLNERIPVSFFAAHGRWRADAFTALGQINKHLSSSAGLEFAVQNLKNSHAAQARQDEHTSRLSSIAARADLTPSASLTQDTIGAILRRVLPREKTTFVVEAVTACHAMHDQLQPSWPGEWVNCGGTGIGWSNGAAVGVGMALMDRRTKATGYLTERGNSLDVEAKGRKEMNEDIVVQIVGDGSFMCAAPSSALWVGARYGVPIITVLLNNGGWHAPHASTSLVYPSGLNAAASRAEMAMSFAPSPDYAGLAEAASAGKTVGVRVRSVEEVERAIQEAVSRVGEGRGTLIECLM